jgi:Transcription factor WhiB
VNRDSDTLLEWLGWQRPAWHRDAACKEHPELDWIVDKGVVLTKQRAICARCLVQPDCAAYAAADATLVGLWGGQTRRGRQQQRAQAA